MEFTAYVDRYSLCKESQPLICSEIWLKDLCTTELGSPVAIPLSSQYTGVSSRMSKGKSDFLLKGEFGNTYLNEFLYHLLRRSCLHRGFLLFVNYVCDGLLLPCSRHNHQWGLSCLHPANSRPQGWMATRQTETISGTATYISAGMQIPLEVNHFTP